MRRIKCKMVIKDTVAKNRSNIKTGKHRRADEKRAR